MRPYLITEIIEINENNLLEALKNPVSRESFEKAMETAFKLLATSAEDTGVAGMKFFKNVEAADAGLSKSGSLSSMREISGEGLDEIMDPYEKGFTQKLRESGISKEEEEKTANHEAVH